MDPQRIPGGSPAAFSSWLADGLAATALWLVLVLGSVGGGSVAAAERPGKAERTGEAGHGSSNGSLYELRQSGDPAGLGKFYMGREIAHFMSHLGAPWLDRATRREEERTDLLLAALPIEPGDTVADIGAGSGYFTLPIAELVGPGGKVLAVDIQPEMLALLTARAAEAGLGNVEPVLGGTTDPGLPAAAIDLALMVDVYHELSHPWEMIDAVVRALRPGGWLVLVEYRGEDPTVPIKRLHKMTANQVRREMAVHDLEFVDNPSFLPQQHLLRFRRRPASAESEEARPAAPRAASSEGNPNRHE